MQANQLGSGQMETKGSPVISASDKTAAEILKRYSNLLNTGDFFRGIDDYAILKLSDSFPNYCDYEDIDILCKDAEAFLRHILEVGKKYQRQGFEIKVDRTNGHLHVDFYPPGAKRLNFRFDLISNFSYEKFEVNPRYCEIVLRSRRRINRGRLEIQVPSVEHDLAIRFFEYAEWHDRRPDKIKHWEYIKKHLCSDFVAVVNRYTNLNISIERVNETINLNVSKKNENDSRPRQIQNSITVEGIEFSDVRPTKCLTNSVGFNSSYIIKIEHKLNPRKLRNIVQEAEIIKYLNNCGCVSCPKLHSVGKLPSGENYIILERLHQKGSQILGDMIFSLIEQKNLGVYQGDFKPENTVFDGSVCYLIDYDQAQKDDRFKQMGNIEFIDWIAKDFRQRLRCDFFTEPSRNFDKQQIYSFFVNDSFDMKYTTVFEKQKTTNTQSGIYHNFIHPKIFIKGARGLEDRKDALDKIEFAKDESVLDVGCNIGLLSHYLHDRGCKVCGVDLDINIILAARMVANIINKNVEFRFCDIDKEKPAEYYDTICLFSVLHHLQNLTNSVEYISAHCGRIILEARLKEGGSKPVDGKWISTSGWNFKSLDEMVKAMEKMFKGFHFDKLYGQCDRNRFVLSMVNPQNTRSVKESKVQTQLSNSSDSDKKSRIDYFLIWGHGLAYTKEILEIIRNHKDLEIVSIVKKSIGDIGKFVEDIYSCDSVPLKHLISKTRYLLNTPPEIIFILVKNSNPQEMFFGEGAFRHIQCKLVKDVKEQIRNQFNPRNKDGTRTENHVIHASDYESQVKHVLNVLGLPPVEYYTRKPNPRLDVPFHIKPFADYTIKQVHIDRLLASILGLGIVPITQTPHYKYVTGDKSAYCDYLAGHFGKELIEDHLPEAYDTMIQNFRYDYITNNGRRSIILAEPFDGNNYRILDGVHRAAILKHRGVQTVTIAEPKRDTLPQETHQQDITALIFSKDRAMQLQAAIESFLLHCRDNSSIQLTVLYKASDELHRQQYDVLKERFPAVSFIEENSFKEQVLAIVEKNAYILFLVDDNIFVKPFTLQDIIIALNEQTDAIGFSLRLGKNTTYCYPANSAQTLPQFQEIGNGVLKYSWPGQQYDFGYPLELSSSVYRVNDILDLLKRLSYRNPNTLESELNKNRNIFSSDKRNLLCFHYSVAFCNPVNKVQNVYAGNRVGADENYTVGKLAELYRQGVTIDVNKFSGFINNGAHQETQLCFKNIAAGPVKISVITPCYNQACYLPQAVESIVNQTYRNWECIIVNDCSTDNTVEVAKQLMAKYADRNIRFIDKPANTGLADARNVGIEAAAGEWILPLDSDDMFEPTFMQKAVDIVHGTQRVDIVFANMRKIGAENGEWIPDEYSSQKILAYNTMPYSSLYRKELWRKVGGYSSLISAIGQSEDWNFWISCSKHNLVVRRIPEKLFLYRVDPNSMYHSLIKNNWHQTWALLATCHPDMYPLEKLAEAWELIASSSPAVYEKILNAVDRCSRYGLIFFWRGLLNERWGKTAEAISDYKMACEKASNGDWQPCARLSVLYEKAGNIQAARQSTEKILSIKPDFKWARDMLFRLRQEGAGERANGAPDICSNLDHWKQLQDNQYFEKHQYYAGLKAYGTDFETINKYTSLSKEMNVVIIGCGYGRETLLIAPHVKHVYGIDVNRTILDKADKYLAERGITNFTSVLAEDWKSAVPGNIDLVYSIVVFQHLTRDLVKDYVNGLAKKLSPNGKFLCQFADLANGTHDAELRPYEPNTRWSKTEIEELIQECGLARNSIDTQDIPGKGSWHWAFFSKQGASRSEAISDYKTASEKAQNESTAAGKKMKFLFYYNGLADLDHNHGGTVAAVLNFAKILSNDRPGITIHLTGDGVRTRRQYEFFELLPLPPSDERDKFIADYDVVFWVTQVIYFKDVPKPHGQVWVLYQHCWDMHKETLSRMSYFDVVLCLSELHAKELACHYGVPAHKQVVVPNLIDTDLYSPRADNRRNHSIIFAGALHEHKGVHILLEAFNLVRQQLRDADLHIYGSRDMWSGTDDYEERLKGMNLENVHFHGYVNPEEMPQNYLKHGIICLPSRLESFGLVIIEAQAGGCIPVAHNAGGVSATLIDGETGFLYSPNTPEKLAQTIIDAIGAIDNNPSMRQRAIDFVHSNFSTQAWGRYRSKFWSAIGISENKNMAAVSSDVNSVGSEEWRLFANGVAELRNGKPEKALDYFSRVLKVYPRLSNLNFAMATAFTQLGKLDSAKHCCEMELAVQPRHSGTAALLERINCAIAQCEDKNSVSDTLLNSGKELIMVSEQKQAPAAGSRTGIIIYGHTRPVLLRNILESLQRQGATSDVHVWLDGHAGRASLKGSVEQCRKLVRTEFPWAVLTTATGNIGIEKLMIDGLSFMSEHYEKIIVLEDDCFPTANAVAEFEKTLDEIEKRDDVYSVYGHHFLTPSEGKTITRFQGWGWATTRKKLLPVLSEMKKCFAMAEHDYLDWVRQNLTPEIIKRLDVTPGRNCVPVIMSHFCWDGCTCLLTAMRGLLHKKTAKRAVYNCGIGDDSMHFRPDDRFRLPPFNMINPGEVWNYYNDSPAQPHSPADRKQTVNSKPAIISNKNQSSQAAEIVVDSICFKNVGRTKHQNNSVGFSDRYIIKIEHEKHPLKLRTLSEEIEIIRYLNEKGCVSCPKLVSEGRLKSGERYCIQQRIDGNREFNAADMVFSILEQKSFGVCQGDFKKENFLVDSNGVCYIIDYDQAVCDERFKSMNGIQYLEWFAQYMVQRWKCRPDDFYKWCGSGRDEVLSLFKNGAFNLARTTIFKEQLTTDSQSGIYHSLNTNMLYIEGCRDLNPRLSALNGIEFKKGEKVLDIGCNMGLLSHYLYDRGCRITGVDMDPKIVTGAKMAANILGKDISFEHLDVDDSPITENYDTICLFSVIHHVKNFSQVTANIAQKCSRIILECGLKEHGSKPVGGEWTKTSGWEFTSLEQLTDYLEKVFTGFKFHNYYGSVDRNRHIISLVKQPLFADGRGRGVQLPAAGNRQTQEKPEYLVSAIVSTYNSEKFIRGCLEDLENQTIADKLEIVVVNSGSEQNEESIVKEFQNKYGNIVYIKTEREGLYSAWNRAVKVASGQFLTNANTDDRHRKDAFEVMANTLLKNTDAALVYGDQIVTDTPNPTFENHHFVELAKRPEFSKERLLFGCCVGSQPMWRKSLHKEFGSFDETLTCAADWDFWLKVASKCSFKHIPESLGLYYRNEQGIEHGRKIHSLYERYVVGRRYGNPYISIIQLYRPKDNPLVSIWMAAYNAADYIERAIESVLIQNYRNFELIVVDDGSTDRTAEIVRGFKNAPIKYFYKEHGGLASARNVQLQKSAGSYIVTLDSDDMMTPDFLTHHLQAFERHPEADLVYCDDYLIDEKDKPIRVIDRLEYSDSKKLVSDLFRCGFPIVPFRTCIRRNVFDKIGLYDERLIVAEDYDMMRRFVNRGLKIQHLPGAFYLRRVNTNSHSRNLNAVKAKSQFEAIRRFTETFLPEQLFPDVQWDKLPTEQKTMLTKCREAFVYLGIGIQYMNSKAPAYAEAAFEMACAEMDDCCKIEPANHQVRNLREKCLAIRDKHSSSCSRGVYQTV